MQTRLLERFLRYVAVTSQSDASQAVVPSTEGQRSLAELLKKDLAELGLVNLEISEYSVLVGKKRTRIYYHIESDGEAYLKELQHDYENMISGMSAIFDSLEKGDTHE